MGKLLNPYLPAHPVRPPLSLLPIAAALQAHGFNPGILDCRVKDYHTFYFAGAVFVGISAMSIGNMISYALDVAQFVRDADESSGGGFLFIANRSIIAKYKCSITYACSFFSFPLE